MTTWYYKDGREFTGTKVRAIDSQTAETSVPTFCKRCGGAGGSDAWVHTGWTCYECGGSGGKGVRTIKLYSKEKVAKLMATAEKRKTTAENKKRAKEAARLAKLEQNKAKVQAELASMYPKQIKILQGDVAGNNFLEAMQVRYLSGEQLSDNMAAAILTAHQHLLKRKIVEAKVNEYLQKDGIVEPGRQAIRGILLTVKEQDGIWGTSLKALFATDKGTKLWGTLPKGIVREDSWGKEFTFTATVEQSKDDPKFGFYKRPAEATAIEEVPAEPNYDASFAKAVREDMDYRMGRKR